MQKFSLNGQFHSKKIKFCVKNLFIIRKMNTDIACALKYHDYELVRYLDNGAFGSCFLVKSLKYKMEFVCKASNTNNLTEKYIQSFVGEAEILSKLNHPNIVRIYDYFIEDGKMFIILEYCSNGSLLDMLRENPNIEKSKMIKYSYQIIDALAFMHSKGIAHCDIKLSNILIDAYDRVKICDFGLSHYIKEDAESDRRIRGTLNYMAPEVILGVEYCPFKADVWALGVTLYALISNQFPFTGKDHHSMLREIKLGYVRIYSNFGPLAGIVDQCLKLEPSERPSLKQLKFKMVEYYGGLLGMKPRSSQKIFASVAKHSIIIHPARFARTSASAVY